MKTTPHKEAFSLVEVLAAVAIIGVVTFLAIPNIVRVKQDSEDNLARARADALNVAVAAYFQASGRNVALSNWTSRDNAGRYELITPYLAYAPTVLSNYMPSGYAIVFSSNRPHLDKAVLQGPGSTNMAY